MPPPVTPVIVATTRAACAGGDPQMSVTTIPMSKAARAPARLARQKMLRDKGKMARRIAPAPFLPNMLRMPAPMLILLKFQVM